MEKSLVIIHGNEGRAGTKIIADGFNRRHEQITRLVKKYREQFEKINTLHVFYSKGKTKRFKEFFLDEYQFAFLATLFKNDATVVEFKLRLILDYKKVKRQLEKALGQKGDPVWDQARLTGKTLRMLETGSIQKFIAYAKEQGGSEEGCDKYYANITGMMNDLLFICEWKFKNVRDVMTPEQLITVGSAEQVISKTLRDGMKNNVHYKAIYQNVKAKVKLFAELHGKSEVISKQLSLI
jgi:phage regulator Rha-like protein